MQLEDPWTIGLRRRNVIGSYDDATETIFIQKKLIKDLNHIGGHELAHHSQNITTPYGAFICCLEWCRFNILIGFFSNLAELHLTPPIILPISEMIRTLPATRHIASDHLSKWNHCVRMKHALEGTKQSNFDQIHSSLKSVYISVQGFRELIPNMTPIIDRDTFFSLPDDLQDINQKALACPYIYENPFGAHQILESLAWIGEIAQSGIHVESPESINAMTLREIEIKYSKEYQSAFLLFLQYFFDKPQFLNYFENLLNNPLIFKSAMFIFMSAAHLALMTPLHCWLSLLTQIRGNDVNWFDIQPGWRFLRICRSSPLCRWQGVTYRMALPRIILPPITQ